MIAAIAQDLVILAALTMLGYLLARVMLPERKRREWLGLAYPLGAGVFTFGILLTSWAGVGYTSAAVLSLLGIMLSSAIVLNLRFTRRAAAQASRAGSSGREDQPALPLLLVLVLIGLLAGTVVLSLSRSYSTWDAMGIWAIKGYGMALEGTVDAGERWGSFGLAYPLNIPLQVGAFQLLNADAYSGSKMLYPLYYVSLLLVSFNFLQRRTRVDMAALGVLLLASTPILFEHATIGYTNLSFTFYLAAGILYGIRGLLGDGIREQLMGGVLLGLALWTRAEGTYLAAAVLVLLFTVAWRSGQQSRLPGLAALLIFLLPWQIFSMTRTEQGFLGRAIKELATGWAQGEFHMDAWYWILRYGARQAVEPSVWGVAVLGSVLAIASAFRRFQDSEYRESTLLLYSAATLAFVVAGYYYAASYLHDIHYLLGTSVNRIFMPVWVLVILVAGSLAAQETAQPLPQVDENG